MEIMCFLKSFTVYTLFYYYKMSKGDHLLEISKVLGNFTLLIQKNPNYFGIGVSVVMNKCTDVGKFNFH